MIALDRMVQHHFGDTDEMRRYWKPDAENDYKDFAGLQAVEWADASTRVQWIYPLKGNESAAGLVLNHEGEQEEAIQTALKNKKGTITKLTNLKQSGLGFLSIHPTYEGSEHSGFIVGVFRTADIFCKMTNKNFYQEIKFEDNVAYKQGVPETRKYDSIQNIKLRNINLTLSLSPSKKLIAEQKKNSENFLKSILIFIVFLVISISSFLLFRYSAKLKMTNQKIVNARSAIDESTIYARTNKMGTIVEVNKNLRKLKPKKMGFIGYLSLNNSS